MIGHYPTFAETVGHLAGETAHEAAHGARLCDAHAAYSHEGEIFVARGLRCPVQRVDRVPLGLSTISGVDLDTMNLDGMDPQDLGVVAQDAALPVVVRDFARYKAVAMELRANGSACEIFEEHAKRCFDRMPTQWQW